MILPPTAPTLARSAWGHTMTAAIQSIDPAATVTTDPRTKLILIKTAACEAAIRQAMTKASDTVA